MEPFRLLGERLFLLDQTALPREELWVEIRSAREMAAAIAELRVRGAPAIGIAGALGLWLEARRITEAGGASGSGAASGSERAAALRAAAESLKQARPTAANLSWAVKRALEAGTSTARQPEPSEWVESIRSEALSIWEEDRAASRAMARWGAELFPAETRFLTHCHTGGLATGGGGTALGVLLAIHRSGRPIRVWATETRPLLQGARLTAWELWNEGVPVRLLVDGAAAHVLSRARIEAVIVGADRVARNGDVANKVGSLPLALAARDCGIPFVVVAPTSTVDLSCSSGDEISIEERDPGEVLGYHGIPTAPADVGAENPAFDITPARLVSAIITERGIHRGPEFRFGEVDTRSKSR